jgi:DNA-binding CsgD family transcriptional regulator
VAIADGGAVEVGSHDQLMAAKGFGHDRCMSRFRSGAAAADVVAVQHQAHPGRARHGSNRLAWCGHPRSPRPSGRELVFHLFAALAEFERDLIRERTTAGLVAARARGRNGGRPPVLDPGQVELARELYASRRYTTTEIARRLKVGRSTLYRHLEQERPIR